MTRQQQSVAFCSAQDNPAVCGQARRRCDNQSHVRFSARTRDQGVRSVRTLRSVRDLLRQKRYYYVRSGVSRTGADPASKFRGRAISVIFGSQVSLRVHNCKSDEVYFTALLRQKQWTTKWPYIVNAVFQIVQNHGEKVTFVGYRGGGDRPNRPLESDRDFQRNVMDTDTFRQHRVDRKRKRKKQGNNNRQTMQQPVLLLQYSIYKHVNKLINLPGFSHLPHFLQ